MQIDKKNDGINVQIDKKLSIRIPPIIQIIFNNYEFIIKVFNGININIILKEDKYTTAERTAEYTYLRRLLNVIRYQAKVHPLYNDKDVNILSYIPDLKSTSTINDIIYYVLIIINILNKYNDTLNTISNKNKMNTFTSSFVNDINKSMISHMIQTGKQIPAINMKNISKYFTDNHLYSAFKQHHIDAVKFAEKRNKGLTPETQAYIVGLNKYLKYKAKYLALKRQLGQ